MICKVVKQQSAVVMGNNLDGCLVGNGRQNSGGRKRKTEDVDDDDSYQYGTDKRPKTSLLLLPSLEEDHHKVGTHTCMDAKWGKRSRCLFVVITTHPLFTD